MTKEEDGSGSRGKKQVGKNASRRKPRKDSDEERRFFESGADIAGLDLSSDEEEGGLGQDKSGRDGRNLAQSRKADGGGTSEDDADGLRDVEDAMLDYLQGQEMLGMPDGEGDLDEADRSRRSGEPEDEEDAERRPTVDESDSSEDERPSRNTIGKVPLKWYKDEKHIGYDKEGQKITKKERADQLDSFLKRADDPKSWRSVYDEYNDEDVVLTKEELAVIRRIREGRIPHAEVNPYEPYVDWVQFDDDCHPTSMAPEPKRRFIPSKWEAKMVVKLVRAMRKGWIKLEKPPEPPKVYLLWGDDLQTANKTANGLTYIAPPKPKLPGHEESYNPPVEYLPTQEEINSYDLMYEEDRPKFIPKRFDSLRKVPAYAEFIKEKFERCLDLYLCPRTRKKRINIDPETLVPKLPKARDLQPFPTTLSLEFRGHTAAVVSISTDPSGQWLASGSKDGTVRVWEVQTGRCRRIWDMGSPVRHVSWNPNASIAIIAVAVEKDLVLLNSELGDEDVLSNTADLLVLRKTSTPESPLAKWAAYGKGPGLQITMQHLVHGLAWHHKGDYFSTRAPDGNTTAVLVHQLSKQGTQNPFRKNHGRVSSVLFHPLRPFFFVATKTHVRIYNLAKQELSKKLLAGVHGITSMAVHPGGDNLIVGSDDKRLCWFDMDLSPKPYRTLSYHDQGIRSVAFHATYPLFASCSDDGSAHVFHGMVYADLLQNPLIVPLKILRGHPVVNGYGAIDCVFHPSQPWLFTAGADTLIRLFCN